MHDKKDKTYGIMAEVITRLNCEEKPHLQSAIIPSNYNSSVSDQICNDSKQLNFNNENNFQTPIKSSTLSKNFRLPRCEAFVMTGDKMLILNPKISPHYAKMRQEQLPPAVEVYNDDNTRKRGLFEEFSSIHQITRHSSRLAANNSENHSISEVSNSYSANLIAFNSTNELDDDQSNQQALAIEAEFVKSNENIKNFSVSTLSNALNDDNTNAMAFDVLALPSSSSNLPKTAASLESRFVTSSHSTCSSPLKMLNQNEDNRRTMSVNHNEFFVSNLTMNSTLPKQDNVTKVATDLFMHQAWFSRNDVANFLLKNDCEFSYQVSSKFMQFFNFSGKRLDVALRDFLNHVCLKGESSERAHLLMYFSKHYFECNPTLFNSIDEIHALSCSLILLNTDLHGSNLGKKMTMREFVNNLLHIQYVYDPNILKTLYKAVKDRPFLHIASAQNVTTSISEGGTNCFSSSVTPILSQNGQCLVANKQEINRKQRHSLKRNDSMFANPREQVDYKRGWLLKKSVYDLDGKKMPFGRRKWIMSYAALRGMALYLHKNERIFERNCHETFVNCIRLHHAIAEVALDYTKKQHVFRLRTANFGEFLFQTSESQEVQRWISAINYVAAAYSTPLLPAPVSSADTNTPIVNLPLNLPITPTTLSMTEQLRAHYDRLDELAKALTKFRSGAPSIKTKGRAVYDYFYRERYLDKERERYLCYVNILNEKLGAVSQLDISSLKSNVTLKKHSLSNNAYLTCQSTSQRQIQSGSFLKNNYNDNSISASNNIEKSCENKSLLNDKSTEQEVHQDPKIYNSKS